MKLKLATLAILSVIFFAACEKEAEQELDAKKYSLTIKDVNAGFDYSFTKGNGRILESPDGIYMLTVKILNEENELVYDQYYYNWDYYGENSGIPDSIYVPDLAVGSYKLFASTADTYYYYDYYWEDSVDHMVYEMNIDPWVVSHGPIYIDNQTFEVSEDTDVSLSMRNISAKVTLNVSNYNYDNQYFWGELYGATASGYSFLDDEFYNEEYGHYTYLYHDPYMEGNFYFLPRTLEKFNVYFENYYSGQYFTTTFFFDEEIEMEVGDALTISVDAEEFDLDGNTSVSWEAVSWNDKGELVFP